MLLGVLMCLVLRSTVSGISIKPNHLCPEDTFQADHELQHLQETVLLLFRPEGEEFLCRNLLQTTLQHQGDEYPLVRCEGVFTIQVSMQGDQFCVYPFNRQQRRAHIAWAREYVSWARQRWDSVLFTDESRLTLESNSGRLLIWRERSTRYQSNTAERHSYRGSGIKVWSGISLGGHTDLHVFQGGTLTGARYRDEILDPRVCPYAGAIGNDFFLMDDNARIHRAIIVEEYLEGLGLERIEQTARSPDLNPIEHLWSYLGRQVAALSPPSRSLGELNKAYSVSGLRLSFR
ncbi:transposable element Tcb2 transposase [Trichonephila clavipes]|nr:transposable element Tcb2 transposase [Trichonephila clavipes]